MNPCLMGRLKIIITDKTINPVVKLIKAVINAFSVYVFNSLLIEDCAVMIMEAMKVMTIWENFAFSRVPEDRVI